MTELEKFIEVEEEWNQLKKFLEWAKQQNWVFVEDTGGSYEERYSAFSIPQTNDEICAAYFGINLGQLEYEKEQFWQAHKEQVRRSKKGA